MLPQVKQKDEGTVSVSKRKNLVKSTLERSKEEDHIYPAIEERNAGLCPAGRDVSRICMSSSMRKDVDI